LGKGGEGKRVPGGERSGSETSLTDGDEKRSCKRKGYSKKP